VHPRDVEPGDAPVPSTTLYFGAAGVVWALERLSREPRANLEALLAGNREWLRANGFGAETASYLMGDTPIELMAYGREPSEARAARLAALIAANREHPARELMWGAPGTLLAAVFLHERTGDARWAELFCDTADTLWSQLEWSAECGCHFWTQDLYGRRSTYLDAVHGFVATASPLARGRTLLGEAAWTRWHEVIVETVGRTATREGPHVNWRPELFAPPGRTPAPIVQFCHGAPGFVVCLGDLPGDELDELLLGAGETTWAAGPLAKGPGLCHGTAGNGYAFLKLHRRTGDARWLARARAFAMHAIAQSERDGPRASLWTGDLGVALYLRACLDGDARFPTLDVFYA
jgi:Lanthionine synthetase C-like protein